MSQAPAPWGPGAPPLNSGGSFQGAGAPVLPRRLCPPPSLPWALSVPFPLHCSFSSKNRSSNLGRTINWGEAKSPKDGEALPPLRGRGDGPRRSASCRQVRVRNAVSGGSDSVSAGPRPLPGQLRTCHRTVTRRKHGAAGALRAFVQRMLRENRSRASGPAQTRDPGRGPWARTLGGDPGRRKTEGAEHTCSSTGALKAAPTQRDGSKHASPSEPPKSEPPGPSAGRQVSSLLPRVSR